MACESYPACESCASLRNFETEALKLKKHILGLLSSERLLRQYGTSAASLPVQAAITNLEELLPEEPCFQVTATNSNYNVFDRALGPAPARSGFSFSPLENRIPLRRYL
jgi:hypothetical protein